MYNTFAREQLQDSSGNIFTGKVWPGICAFVDYMNPEAQSYWQSEVEASLHTCVEMENVVWCSMCVCLFVCLLASLLLPLDSQVSSASSR